jgi:hypothetical protein
MLNKTRQLLSKALGRPQNLAEKAKVMETARNLKNMQKHPGWEAVHDWIDTQRTGAKDALDINFAHINLLTLPLFFNSFLKYFFVILELRAYKKIDTYIRITIQRGDKYAAEAAKQAEREERKS